jgi:hypothetical protein
MLTNSPHNPWEKAEAVEILRLFIIDIVRVAILRTHTIGATREETMD